MELPNRRTTITTNQLVYRMFDVDVLTGSLSKHFVSWDGETQAWRQLRL